MNTSSWALTRWLPTGFPVQLAISISGFGRRRRMPAGCGRVLERFGAPRSRLTPETFTEADVVYQIGLPPNRIDLLTTIDGVEFEDACQERVECVVDQVSFRMVSRRHLLANKRATGRPQDLADVARLEGLD